MMSNEDLRMSAVLKITRVRSMLGAKTRWLIC